MIWKKKNYASFMFSVTYGNLLQVWWTWDFFYKCVEIIFFKFRNCQNLLKNPLTTGLPPWTWLKCLSMSSTKYKPRMAVNPGSAPNLQVLALFTWRVGHPVFGTLGSVVSSATRTSQRNKLKPKGHSYWYLNVPLF
jgi:hypothetical protein